MCGHKKIFSFKLSKFSQITYFGLIIEYFLELREILTNNKYHVLFMVSVVIKIEILFKITSISLNQNISHKDF